MATIKGLQAELIANMYREVKDKKRDAFLDRNKRKKLKL